MMHMKYVRSIIVVIVGMLTAGFLRGLSDVSNGAPTSPADLKRNDWKAALRETKSALKDKDLSTMAAGLAYYTTLTFFPAVLGLATVYTAVAGPQSLLALLDSLTLVLPPALQDLMQSQLSPLARASGTSLGIATIVSLVAVLWTTSGGLQNLVKALNTAYGVSESRGIIKLRLVSISLSAVLIVFTGIVLALLMLQQDALYALGMPAYIAEIFPVIRWVILAAVLSLTMAVLYRYAPNRSEPRWSWVSWGATAATIIWLVGTALFFMYVQNFGNFNESYGTFAGIIVLMVWFNLSSLIILMGAQVNSKLELVARRDYDDVG